VKNNHMIVPCTVCNAMTPLPSLSHVSAIDSMHIKKQRRVVQRKGKVKDTRIGSDGHISTRAMCLIDGEANERPLLGSELALPYPRLVMGIVSKKRNTVHTLHGNYHTPPSCLLSSLTTPLFHFHRHMIFGHRLPDSNLKFTLLPTTFSA
jgi:hypothetical protein